MTRAGKPAPGTGETLPYPTTPDSPKPDYGEFRSDYDTTGQRLNSQHYLNPNPASQSQTSIPSVSDLSEGWVDGDPKAHGDELFGDMGKKEAEVPEALKIKKVPVSPERSSESQVQPQNSDIPQSLRVQAPQGGQSTNPFHRESSLEGRLGAADNTEDKRSSFWAKMAEDTPPEEDHRGRLAEQPTGYHTPAQEFGSMSLNPAPQELPISTPKAKEPANYEHPTSNPFQDPYRDELENSPWGTNIPPQSSSADPYGTLDALDKREEEDPKYAVPTDEANSKFASSQSHPPMPPRTENVKNVDGVSEPEQPLRVQVPQEPAPYQPEAETPNTKVQKQRSETYQIKHIRWLDSSSTAVRTTPIMVQNANGPCPLLALVNALTLSTPAQLNTPLVETLRVRENVTLGLLLDAVFDELMSGRRGTSAQELPDVGELYSFLINLHTGLNVNPKFVTVQVPDLMEGMSSQSPTKATRESGGFEDTKEMKLYATFAIPLIHGWLPPQTHPAYPALYRSANSYEDAQNLLFREEELEDKLQNHGLTAEEQQLLEDIASVKYFLSSSATQLTGYGLDIITDSLMPGSIAILFRNDHFSTLYKHPKSGQILTLVTDAGYAGHEEVVWESLVDVSGEGSEFYAGDFRPVGHQAAQHAPSLSQDDSGWTTVQRNNRNRTPSSPPPPPQPPRPGQQQSQQQQQQLLSQSADDYNLSSTRNTEQEDADLALALQLQEEEEENDRRASAARRREEEAASQAYLTAEGSGPRSSSQRQNSSSQQQQQQQSPQPNTNTASGRRAARHQQSQSQSQPPLPGLPPRRTNNNNNRDPEAGIDAPPPTYEQASKGRPYIPPANQPAYNNPNSVGGNNAAGALGLTHTQGAYAAHRQSLSGSGGGGRTGGGRRTSSGQWVGPGSPGGMPGGMQGGMQHQGQHQGQGQDGRKERDCVVM